MIAAVSVPPRSTVGSTRIRRCVSTGNGSSGDVADGPHAAVIPPPSDANSPDSRNVPTSPTNAGDGEIGKAMRLGRRSGAWPTGQWRTADAHRPPLTLPAVAKSAEQTRRPSPSEGSPSPAECRTDAALFHHLRQRHGVHRRPATGTLVGNTKIFR